MATFGETLKRERELRKISLREVSESTKIGLKYLEALEGNRFDHLPGGLFNKGFIRAYAKFIGLDGETLINSYLYDLAHQRNTDPARPRCAGMLVEESPPPETGVPALLPPRPFPIRLVAGAAAGLMVAAAGVWLMIPRPSVDSAPAPLDANKPIESPTQMAGLLHPAPALTQPAQEQAPEAVQEIAATPAPELPAPAAPEKQEKAPPEIYLDMFIGTAEPTEIVVICEGVEKVRQELSAGETVAVSCRGEVLLGAGNAGALSLKINGRECLPLGERGAALVDFRLDAQRAAEICPRERRVR